MDNLPKQGHVTLIPSANVEVSEEGSAVKLFVTGWSEPNHILKSHVANEPLEDGAVITDHVIALPVELTLKGFVSDVVHGAQSGTYAWNKIRELHDKEVLLDVSTEWGYYTSMAIKSVEAKQANRSLQFSLSLQQITRVGFSVFVIENPRELRQDPKETYVTVRPTDLAGVAVGASSGKIDSAGPPIDEDIVTEQILQGLKK